MKPVIPRALAQRDVDHAVVYYAGEAGDAVALRFVEALRDAYRVISARPAIGSPRFGDELELPGLGGRRLKRFPFLVCYIDRSDHIDVWRVLHTQRDIPAWMSAQS